MSTPPLPALGPVDHLALTVTDPEVSQRFYSTVFGFRVVMDVGYGLISLHPVTGFVLALVTHEGAYGGGFTELTTGLDHLGFAASSRAELEEWQRHFEALGVVHTPIRDMEFGAHLNFRDPDGIALEISSSNELMAKARAALSSGEMTADDIAAFVSEHVGPDVARRPPS